MKARRFVLQKWFCPSSQLLICYWPVALLGISVGSTRCLFTSLVPESGNLKKFLTNFLKTLSYSGPGLTSTAARSSCLVDLLAAPSPLTFAADPRTATAWLASCSRTPSPASRTWPGSSSTSGSFVSYPTGCSKTSFRRGGRSASSVPRFCSCRALLMP